MHSGIMAHADGLCPICGRGVARTHSFNGRALVDHYACYRCGPTRYAVAV